MLKANVCGVISRGIKGAHIDEEGHLIFTLTDNTTLDVGAVTVYAEGVPIYTVNGKRGIEINLTPADVGALAADGKAKDADKADRAANADRAAFDLPLYSAALTQSGWTGSGGAYVQTAACAPADGGPALTASVQLSGPMCRPTGTQATDEALQDALSIINAGVTTPGDGAVTVKVWEKPESNITVYWYGR